MVLRPSWFPEYSPAEQLIFDEVKKIITATYSQFGFAHIQTPAVEANSVLLSKNWEEAGKQIFWLYGLAQGAEDAKEYSLHFDLTVPFARYALDRENDIAFPFKRFQIQPVWRGERAQRGRFREFRQADIDVIWNEWEKTPVPSLAGEIWKNLYYDAETLVVITKTIGGIVDRFFPNKTFTLHMNNRYLLSGFFSQFPADKVPELYHLLDKYYKMPFETFQAALEDIVSKADAKKILTFVKSTFEDLTPDMVADANYKKWYEEVKQVLDYVHNLNSDKKYNIVRDPCIIRGLDYYTGTVYETFFDDDIALGSISSGGRYENLTGYINPKKTNYAGVGWSIGLSRIVYLILEKTKPEHTTQTEYLFVNFPETHKESLGLMQQFIKEGKCVEFYPSADKLGKQFGYADKKWIPYVVILGEGEKAEGMYKIKNMKVWTEENKKI